MLLHYSGLLYHQLSIHMYPIWKLAECCASKCDVQYSGKLGKDVGTLLAAAPARLVRSPDSGL